VPDAYTVNLSFVSLEFPSAGYGPHLEIPTDAKRVVIKDKIPFLVPVDYDKFVELWCGGTMDMHRGFKGGIFALPTDTKPVGGVRESIKDKYIPEPGVCPLLRQEFGGFHTCLVRLARMGEGAFVDISLDADWDRVMQVRHGQGNYRACPVGSVFQTLFRDERSLYHLNSGAFLLEFQAVSAYYDLHHEMIHTGFKLVKHSGASFLLEASDL